MAKAGVCGHPKHRALCCDWSKPGVGLVVCGVCHPPAASLFVVDLVNPRWKRGR